MLYQFQCQKEGTLFYYQHGNRNLPFALSCPVCRSKRTEPTGREFPDLEEPGRQLGRPVAALHCEWDSACTDPVTHLDEKGFVYCRTHGKVRKESGRLCRALTVSELRVLRSGKPLPSYRRETR